MADPHAAPLLPCPFCGGLASLEEGYKSDDTQVFYGLCCDCGARGRNRYTRADAIAAWNHRAPAPAAEGRGDVAKLRERAERIVAYINEGREVGVTSVELSPLAAEHVQEVARALLAALAAPAAPVGLWRCENCGEAHDPVSPSWRWAHRGPEHRCEGLDPQAGHMPARWFGEPAPAAEGISCKTCSGIQAVASEHMEVLIGVCAYGKADEHWHLADFIDEIRYGEGPTLAAAVAAATAGGKG